MAKILILIGGHLCTAPRPHKEAETLANAGHDVTIVGIWFDPELVKRDRQLITNQKWHFKPALDFQPHYQLRHWCVRSQARLAREQYHRFQTCSPNLLGYGARAMLKIARQTRADLTIVHSEAGLWVGSQLLDEGFRVGVDFEDWFSEDLLPEARLSRPIAQLKELECRLIRECQYCLTTSDAMATAIATAYDAPKPTVIYNCFPWSERAYIDQKICDRKDPNLPSLHWFSQTIGPGRGLEGLFRALPYLNIPMEIHLRGNCSDSAHQWLKELVPEGWSDRIFIHPTVPNHELLSRIAEHDVGLALESHQILSRDLTITNKLFQYLQAGLAVIATDTAGQREVFNRCPQIGKLVVNEFPEILAQALKEQVCNNRILEDAKSASLKIAQEAFCWEENSANLLECCHKSL